MINNLSARERMLVRVFLFILAVSMSFRFFLLPSFAEYISARDQLIKLKSEKKAEKIDARVMKEAQALNNEKKRWEAVIANFPREGAGGNFISDLGRMCARYSVIVKSIQSSPASQRSGISIQSYCVELQGSYENIICIMKVMEEGDILIYIKNSKFITAKGDVGIKTEDLPTGEDNYPGPEGNLLAGPVLARVELDVYILPG